MKELIAQITKLASEELERANNKFPPFNSTHEGYAVLLEEIEEVESEIILIQTDMAQLWESVKNNKNPEMAIEKISRHSANLAAESVQVTAMCNKFTKLLEREEKE